MTSSICLHWYFHVGGSHVILPITANIYRCQLRSQHAINIPRMMNLCGISQVLAPALHALL